MRRIVSVTTIALVMALLVPSVASACGVEQIGVGCVSQQVYAQQFVAPIQQYAVAAPVIQQYAMPVVASVQAQYVLPQVQVQRQVVVGGYSQAVVAQPIVARTKLGIRGRRDIRIQARAAARSSVVVGAVGVGY